MSQTLDADAVVVVVVAVAAGVGAVAVVAVALPCLPCRMASKNAQLGSAIPTSSFVLVSFHFDIQNIISKALN